MFKFLRQYQGWILAVFGTILLISFLLPQAIQGLSQYAAQTGGDWAEVGDGETVTTGRLQELQAELRILELASNPFINALGAANDPAYWYLLSREAEQAGLVGGPGSGERMAESMSLQSNGAVSPTTLIARMQGTSGFNTQKALQTLAKIQGVGRLSQQFQTAARFSDVRLQNTAAKLGMAVDADLLILDAKRAPEDSDEESSEAPDEESLQTQFTTYREVLAGDGDTGFGYKFEDRAELEWLMVDREQVSEALTNGSGIDPITMRKAFMQDPERFGAIAVGGEKPAFKDYENSVRRILGQEELDDRMKEIAKFLNDQIQLPRRGLSRTGGEYSLPEDWAEQRANYDELATAMVEEFGLDTPPSLGVSDGLLTASEINAIEGLGQSRSNKFGTRAISPGEYVMSATEFGKQDVIPSQLGVSSPVFTDNPGNLYIFRLIKADREHPPANLDEVRDQVERDVRNLERYQKLVAEIPQLEARAAASGLQTIAEENDVEVRFQANIAEANPQFLRYGIKSPTRILGLAPESTVVNQIIERSEGLDYTIPAGDLPASKRIFFIPDEKSLSVIGVQIASLKPMTQESWRELADSEGLFGIMASEETASDLLETFSLKALRKRHNFRYMDRETQAAAEAEDAGISVEDGEQSDDSTTADASDAPATTSS
ncbi:MAG: hypothetical protein VX641_07580 [Planctomycetota bacterium]|nr:hypothetical protein [Planctomycetota bacterium]